MNNNCNNVGFGMQRFKDDMLGISVESTSLFIWSLGVFTQSSKLWAHLVEKLIQSPYVFSQLKDKWAHLAEGVQGERSGVNTYNVRRLWMWSNRKMKFATFIHNDDVKCFHMVVQRTHELIVMVHINFEDHALI
jgi:hypothetical protein